MRVAVYHNNKDVRIEEMPVPKIGPGELLVKILASGICGSDVLEWYRTKRAPLVLGHEIAGEIVEIGEGVGCHRTETMVAHRGEVVIPLKQGLKGDRVFVSHHVPCNTCYYCLRGDHTACETLHTTNFDPGGFAEYVRVPPLQTDRGVFVLPNEMSLEEGVFIEPLACVVRGQREANLRTGDCVLVIGSGIAGLLHIALAKAVGAGRIIATDINDYRMNHAERFGADVVINGMDDVPALVKEANGGRGVDIVIVCAGALAAFEQALESVDSAGTVLCFATTEPGVELSVPINDFWRSGVKLLPSYGNAPHDALMAIELIRAGRVPVKEMVTHRLPLEEIQRGFDLVAGAGESLKVIIEPSNG